MWAAIGCANTTAKSKPALWMLGWPATPKACVDSTSQLSIRCCGPGQCQSVCHNNRSMSPLPPKVTTDDLLPRQPHVWGWWSSHSEAKTECAARGLRLCSRTELHRNKGCRAGCNMDPLLVWTSEPCSEQECINCRRPVARVAHTTRPSGGAQEFFTVEKEWPSPPRDPGCPHRARIANCRFSGRDGRREHQGMEYDEAHKLCCDTCVGGFVGCTGFSIETTRTVIRATNATAFVAHSCVYNHQGEDPKLMTHKREPYQAIGHERVTRVASDCFVTPLSPPPSPSPAPPDPPPAPQLDSVLPEVAELVVEVKDSRRRAEEAMGKEHDRSRWWSWLGFESPDIEEDHHSPWFNRTPVPKVKWHPKGDAFERL